MVSKMDPVGSRLTRRIPIDCRGAVDQRRATAALIAETVCSMIASTPNVPSFAVDRVGSPYTSSALLNLEAPASLSILTNPGATANIRDVSSRPAWASM